MLTVYFQDFFKTLVSKASSIVWVQPMQIVKHVIFREAFLIPSLMC